MTRNKITAFTTALVTLMTASSGFIKTTADEVRATTASSIGDVNKDGVIDVFDNVSLRRSGDGVYSYEVQQYILSVNDEIIADKTVDSDGDKISDWDEVNIYGTDPKKPDTDGDKLTDYEEIFLTKTDPLVADSFKKGVLDGDADCDGDGLSNLDEIRIHKTDPLKPDTDGDGLTDYDEINVYKTNPLVPDTDGDGISDGDEIKLGLDPTKPKSNGTTADAARLFTQIIPANHEILTEINTADNPYKLSIEITAAGFAENNLEVMQSGYTYAMCGGSSLGFAPELVYNENYAVQSIKLKFEIGKDYISNVIRPEETKSAEISGIKRLNVFKYFEDTSMLLPIETQYDVANNIVYATLDVFEKDESGKSYGIGSYCLTDLEMWTGILVGTHEDQNGISDFDYSAVSAVDSQVFSVEETSETPEFFAQPTVQSSGLIFEILKGLNNTVRFSNTTINNGNIIIPTWEFGTHKYALIEKAVSWAEAQEMCKAMGGHLATVTSSSELGFIQRYVSTGANSSFYWVGGSKTGSTWSWVTNESMDYVNSLARSYTSQGMNAFPKDKLYYATDFNSYGTSNPNLMGFICEWEPGRAIRDPANKMTYAILLPFGDKFVSLDGILNSANGIDTDGDGIPDWKEINHRAIKKISGSDTANLWQCLKYTDALGFKLDTNYYNSKVKAADFRYNVEMLSQLTVYPVYSDPTDPDTDGDYYLDGYDNRPLEWDKMKIPDGKIRDTDSIYGENPSTSVASGSSDGELTRFTDEQKVTKNLMTFYRSKLNKDQRCEFSLKPEKSGDYVITISNVNITSVTNPSGFITISNNKKTLIGKEVKHAVPKQYNAPKYIANTNSVMLYYSLHEDGDYTIKVTNNIAKSSFSVSIRQDNWIFAPNGGVRTEVKNEKGYITNETYLTAETMYTMIQGQREDYMGLPYTFKTAADMLKSDKFNLGIFVEDEGCKFALKGFEMGNQDANDIINSIRGYTRPAGIVFAKIPGGQLIGTVIGIVNGGLSAVSLYNGGRIKDLKRSMIDGKLNLCIAVTTSGNVDYMSWNDTHYINKYYKPLDGWLTGDTSLQRCKDIITFDMNSQTVEKVGNTWRLVG